MQEAPIPPDDVPRVAALHALGVLYSPAEERFDRITRLACRLFDVPIALVSLVAEKCQWFKSRQGLDVAETPRRISFCGHAILRDEPLVVPDALLDERFHDNPLVVGEPYIRFYAGAPLSDGEGNKLGTLCIIDRRPRVLGEAELDLLRDLAAWAENELRIRKVSESQKELLAELDSTKREARVDPLTQVWNRRALGEILERELARADRRSQPVGIVMLDLDRFKLVNDLHGHKAGDIVLAEAARRMRSKLRLDDALCRFGGEEFVAVLSNCGLAEAGEVAEKIRKRIEAESFDVGTAALAVTASLGVAEYRSGSSLRPDELLKMVDEALYRAKSGGRNRVESAR